MTDLNDTQRVLLATAAQRGDGSILPLAGSLKPGTRIAKAIADLLDRGFADERETRGAAAVHRTDGDLRFGVFASATGLAAIGIGEPLPDARDAAPQISTPAIPKATKNAVVIALLTRDTGATLADLIAATDWLPHTTRAALTGLRKKGHVIERGKRGDDTCYRIVAAG